MYQSLIWSMHLRDEASRLAAALDPEKVQSAADALVDGVRGNTEFDRNLLGREMLVYCAWLSLPTFLAISESASPPRVVLGSPS
jgi:hypothetical protein